MKTKNNQVAGMEAEAYTPRYLGKRDVEFTGLDPIPIKSGDRPDWVEMSSDEVTAMCPLTGQPDQYVVTLSYKPGFHLCESKSLKLLFQSFRNQGHFAEALAVRIADQFDKDILPQEVHVTVEQKARGGVTLRATSKRPY